MKIIMKQTVEYIFDEASKGNIKANRKALQLSRSVILAEKENYLILK